MKEPKMQLIDMNLIDPNPDNDKVFNMDAISYLADGIKEEGFVGSIEVFQKPDGRYEISAGHRRFEAMKLLKEKQIPCTVIHSADNISKAKRLLSSNLKNRVLKPMDYARAIRYYKDNVIKPQNIKGQTEKLCVSYFNMSISTIKRYESLLKLIPELQNLSDEVEFPYAILSSASTLSNIQQKELYLRIKDFAKENETNMISGLRLSQMIDSIKTRDNYKKQENGTTRNNQDSNFTQNNETIENESKSDNVVFMNAPVIEKKMEYNKTENDIDSDGDDSNIDEGIIVNIDYMDQMLEVYTEQLQHLANGNYQVRDLVKVSSQINILKSAVEKLEQTIKK